MSELKIAREGEKKGDKLKLTSIFTEMLELDEFNERMIRQYQESETIKSQLELLSSKILRLNDEVKSTPEIEKFKKMLVDAKKLEELDNLRKKYAEISKQVELAEKDMISLRTIQSDLKLIKDRKGLVEAKTID